MTRRTVRSTATFVNASGQDTHGHQRSQSTSEQIRVGKKLEVQCRKWFDIFGLTEWGLTGKVHEFGEDTNDEGTPSCMYTVTDPGLRTATISAAYDHDWGEGEEFFNTVARHELAHIVMSDSGIHTYRKTVRGQNYRLLEGLEEVLCDRIAVIAGRAYEAGRASRRKEVKPAVGRVAKRSKAISRSGRRRARRVGHTTTEAVSGSVPPRLPPRVHTIPGDVPADG